MTIFITRFNYRIMKAIGNPEFNKEWSLFKRDAKIKDCFYFDHSTCKGKIIKAHSLQRNGVLDLITSEVGGNKVVYSLGAPLLGDKGSFIGFQPLGIKSASTFTGFCEHHDKQLFRKIEDQDIDFQNDEHCFLLSYRSFGRELHAKAEVNKGYRSNHLYNRPEFRMEQMDMLAGSTLGLRDNFYLKLHLDEMLKSENFGELEYWVYTLPHMVPIACASAITPYFTYHGTPFNIPSDVESRFEIIMISMLPTDKGETHILFAWLPEDKKSGQFMNELAELPDRKLHVAISSILIGEIENTFFSPAIWDKLSSKDKKQLLKELAQTAPHNQTFQKKFFKTKLNLLHEKFNMKKG